LKGRGFSCAEQALCFRSRERTSVHGGPVLLSFSAAAFRRRGRVSSAAEAGQLFSDATRRKACPFKANCAGQSGRQSSSPDNSKSRSCGVRAGFAFAYAPRACLAVRGRDCVPLEFDSGCQKTYRCRHPESERHCVQGEADRNVVHQPVIVRVHTFLLRGCVR